MVMTPVPWAVYGGETLEIAMGVMLRQEHTTARRRRPSQGDGGVDIVIGTPGGWHVHQIKGFTGSMDSSRRRQVKESLDAVLADPRLDRPIAKWSLTVPMDPTSEDEAWFNDLTSGVPFEREWNGQVFWELMAARNPHVIDYYLGNGRERLRARADLLLSTSDALSGPLTAPDVGDYLERLRRGLNDDDPHFRYEFQTGPPPSPDMLPSGCVAMSSRGLADGSCLTTFVFERFVESLLEAPIGGDLRVTVYNPGRGIDIREAFDDFQRYGRALDLPEGALDGEMSAPTGFGGAIEGAAGRFGPIQATNAPATTRLRVIDPGGNAVELSLATDSATRGPLDGVEVETHDGSGVLAVRFQLSPPREGETQVKIAMDLGALAGRPAHDVFPVARLLGSLGPGTEFSWMAEYGTEVFASHTLDSDFGLRMPGVLVRFFENLALLQNYVRGTVVVPQLIDAEARRVVGEVARLLRDGEAHGTWDDALLHTNEHADRAELEAILRTGGSLVVEKALAIEIDDRRYDFGPMHQVFATAQLADEQADNTHSLRIVPGSDNTFVQRLGPLPSAGAV